MKKMKNRVKILKIDPQKKAQKKVWDRNEKIFWKTYKKEPLSFIEG